MNRLGSYIAQTATHGAAVTPGAPEGLRIERVNYGYGDSPVLQDVSLEIERGEFVSILGPSGCGKTTLLRLIAGLQRPQAGRIVLDGRDITRLPPEKRPLGMVFQNLALFPHLSVRENVAFSLAVKRRPRRERLLRADQMLDLVGLSGYGERGVGQLSGGQQQRVALARSIIAEPELLLLDEPLGALDAGIRRDMQIELKSLQRRLSITFLFVTHDQTEAMSMSDRVILMNHGKVIQDAPPLTLYNSPKSSFVAQFIGETNLIEGVLVESSADECVVTLEDLRLRIPVPCPDDVSVGSPVQVSLRPEHFDVISDEVGLNRLSGKVASQSFYGAEVMLEVDASCGRLRVRQASRSDLTQNLVGRTITLAVNSDAARLFPIGAA